MFENEECVIDSTLPLPTYRILAYVGIFPIINKYTGS